MALDSDDQKTLQEIVEKEGNCLDSKRCRVCPFRAQCLPEFLYPNPPSQPQRLKMALKVLTHHFLIDQEMSKADVEEDTSWNKK